MKKKALLMVVLIMVLTACSTESIPEPAQCAMCDDLPRHAPCIINLSTGEKLELDIYEPHPFLVGELAEEQPGGYFSLIRSAGVEGYKVGAEYIVVTIPIKSEKLSQQYFCNFCRERLADNKKSGFVLADVKNPSEPIVYSINTATLFSVRCYSVSVQENVNDNEYQITITGHHEN